MEQKITDKQVISMFQRYLSTGDPSEIRKVNLVELTASYERLRIRGINSIFADAIKNKIHELELIETRKHESKIRAWNLVTGLILGVTVAGIAAWIFTT